MAYTSTDFDGQRSADYTLLIQVTPAENIFAVVDEEGQLKFFTSADSKQVIDTSIANLLNLTFNQVKIVVPDQSYSFIPADIFDESYLAVYQRYLPNDGLTDPLVSAISSLDIQLIYQINRIGLNAYTTKFSQASIYPAIQSFLCGIGNYGTQIDQPILAIDKTGSTVRISFFDSGKFCYCNDFEVNQAADLNYYLLAVLAHFKLEDKQPQLLLSGDIALGDEYNECVKKYSDTVDFADIKQLTGVAVPSVLQHDQHRFLPLFGLNVCE